MGADLLSALFFDPMRTSVLGSQDWEAVLGQARRGRLLPRLAQLLLDNGSFHDVPAAPRKHLIGALRLAERQLREVLWEIEHLRRALSSLGVPVVLLKGAAYVAAGLPPAPARLFSDIDILVHKARLPEVEARLFSAGWISVDREPYTVRYYRDWMHEIPALRHVERGTNLDVHHTITAPTSRFAVDGSTLIRSARPLPDRASLWVLDSADMVLHSAAHLFQEGEFDHGLRDLLDIHDLLLHFGRERGFWDQLLARAAELDLHVPLSHALVQLSRLGSCAIPAAMSDRIGTLDRSVVTRRLMGLLLGLALKPHHPSCSNTGSDLARWLLYVRSHWLRMPPHLLAYHLSRKLFMRVAQRTDSNSPV